MKPLRRNDSTGELAYHLCYFPVPASLPQLVWVARRRGGATAATAADERDRAPAPMRMIR